MNHSLHSGAQRCRQRSVNVQLQKLDAKNCWLGAQTGYIRLRRGSLRVSNILLCGSPVFLLYKMRKRSGFIATDKPDTQRPNWDDPQVSAETPLSTPSAEVVSSLLTADRSLTRFQSLPNEATRSLEGQAEEPSAQPDFQRKHEGSPKQQQQPRSPPPNTLWNTPRASDRCLFMLSLYQLSWYCGACAVRR